MLAWQLLQRGREIMVVDRAEESTSSKVAAGLVNPITGRYLTKSWRIDETLPVAWHFYREMEKLTGSEFLYEMPIVRLFKSDDEVARWEKRRANPGYQAYLHEDPARWLEFSGIESRLGGFATKHSG
ncbi:MAG: FAD-dependent oxidoreductase, partial [Verrucomicrobiales bacterium]